jgi:hypothetical protein
MKTSRLILIIFSEYKWRGLEKPRKISGYSASVMERNG